MRILLTNDDGYASQGLNAVARLLKDKHEVVVVAPDVQKSAYSRSISLYTPFACKEIAGYDYKVFAVCGTPTDCVKIGCQVLFPNPDLVISGINDGENLGSDIWYSGTVAAASEAVYLGCRALALSIDKRGATADELARCVKFLDKNLDALVGVELPEHTLLNINFPACEPIGVKIVKMNTQQTFIDEFVPTDNGLYAMKGYRNFEKLDERTDEFFCHKGYITVTPLLCDRTDYSAIKQLENKEFKI